MGEAMSRNVLHVSMDDVRVRVVCPSCKQAVIESEMKSDAFDKLHECFSCGYGISTQRPGETGKLRSFQNAWNDLKDNGPDIEFAVDVSQTGPQQAENASQKPSP